MALVMTRVLPLPTQLPTSRTTMFSRLTLFSNRVITLASPDPNDGGMPSRHCEESPKGLNFFRNADSFRRNVFPVVKDFDLRE
jgi:hypothetical protein